MYAKALAIASLATAVVATPGSAPPSYGSASVSPVSSSPVSAPAYGSSSTPVSPVSYSTSAPVSSAPVPSGSAYPSCWATCFTQAGITSESALCGNTAVDACIQDSCSSAEDQAYWAWYESYCPATTTAPATSSAAAYSSTPVSSAPVIPTSSAPACWTACFAENNVTSEAELCGDDAVSQCIYSTCDAADDQAYWAWYEGYCTGPATVTTVITLTSPCAYTSSGAVQTSWESTAWTPAGAPTSGAAPYPTGGWGTTSAAAATGTAAAWPTSSGWPVPATGGAGTVAKSGFALLAGFLGLVALL